MKRLARGALMVAVGFATMASGSCSSTRSSAQQPVIDVPDNDIVQSMKWSPDGRHLVVHVLTNVRTGPAVYGALLLLDGVRLRQVSSVDADITSFDWMPDAASLIVAEAPVTEHGHGTSRIAVIDLDGNQRSSVTPSPSLQIVDGMTVDSDARHVIAVAGRPDPRGQPLAEHLWSVSLVDGVSKQLDVELGGTPADPRFDSSARLVTIVRTERQSGGGGDDHLARVLLQTLAVERITPINDNVATFSLRDCPDDIVYTSAGVLQGGGVLPVYNRLGATGVTERVGTLSARNIAAARTGTTLAYTTYVPFAPGADVQIHLYAMPACSDAPKHA